MSIKSVSTYCIVPYQSSRGIDDRPTYAFWFTSSLVKIVGDKPFGRGDIVLLETIEKTNINEWTLECKVVGDPEIDPEAKQLSESSDREIPTLLFLTTKIYLHEDAEVDLTCTDNITLLLSCSSIINNNKSYTVVALIKGKQGRIRGLDSIHKTPLNWLITDSPKR